MNLRDEIEKIAYELYEKKGRVHGDDFKDWLEAERIAMARYSEASKSSVETPGAVKPKRQGKATVKSTEKKEEKTARKKTSATTVKKAARKKKTE